MIRSLRIPGERAFRTVDLKLNKRLPSSAYLRNSHDTAEIVFEPQQHGCIIISRNFHIITFGVGSSRESFHRAARALSDRDHGGEIRAHFNHFLACQPHDQVEPVGPDIGYSPQFAAQLRLQTPVPIGRVKEPILKETSTRQTRLSDSTLTDKGTRFLAERIIPKVVTDATNTLASLCQVTQCCALAGIHC